MSEEQVHNQVRELRREAGMTQADLAGKVAVTRQTIIAIERGNYIPSVLLALKLARAFNISVETIFSYE